ncbi:hypothetical protein EMIHUDRAFT_449715 [Emiliania huxleyi CCMP1516]|uniref:GAF domain-containing protein n=2 Tax=Emiliania huxleyi TaxID=2903 RepID=A0A0D3K2I2_EMIH1|nr:hypothetical protein EMIHUDRAFT_449715 [Emiliania huxleyi CCMP1516]EOD29967.1 hypothetical protein EMIHUDRAFT_449715 [Emiliania huxleyi CCMP1516]|eukprot:XP_005782396.1 hypothetical protein EMIHUDRAFT_449715 [Emiliania huxleyi CCMP1516]
MLRWLPPNASGLGGRRLLPSSGGRAGDLIDTTLGVTLGFSTLTAAALGNVCSDTSGTLFGGVVETLAARLQLTPANLSPEQLKMRISRQWALGGATVGVICGCLLGMSTLCFMDLEKSDRLKRAAELDTIFTHVVEHGYKLLGAERTGDSDSQRVDVFLALACPTRPQDRLLITLPLEKDSIATAACKSREIVNAADDPRFDGSWDAKSGFVTKQVLAMPILTEEGELIGCVEAVNKVAGGAFTDDDERLMRMLCDHIAVFVDHVHGLSE